jgi:hypothetical protein
MEDRRISRETKILSSSATMPERGTRSRGGLLSVTSRPRRPPLVSTRISPSSISPQTFLSDLDGQPTRGFLPRHFRNRNVDQLNALVRQLWDKSESLQAELTTAQNPAEIQRITAELQTVKEQAFKILHELNQRRLLASTTSPRRSHIPHTFSEGSAGAVRQHAQAEMIRASRERTIHPAVVESTIARRREMVRLLSENMPSRSAPSRHRFVALFREPFQVPRVAMVIALGAELIR